MYSYKEHTKEREQALKTTQQKKSVLFFSYINNPNKQKLMLLYDITTRAFFQVLRQNVTFI